MFRASDCSKHFYCSLGCLMSLWHMDLAVTTEASICCSNLLLMSNSDKSWDKGLEGGAETACFSQRTNWRAALKPFYKVLFVCFFKISTVLSHLKVCWQSPLHHCIVPPMETFLLFLLVCFTWSARDWLAFKRMNEARGTAAFYFLHWNRISWKVTIVLGDFLFVCFLFL